MIFLSAFGDFAAYLSATMALGALIVSIISLLSKKRIEGIVELGEAHKKQVDELIRQNDILIKSLNINSEALSIQKKLSRPLLRPYFTKIDETPHGSPNAIIIHLRNSGLTASRLIIQNHTLGNQWNAQIQGPVIIEPTRETRIVVTNTAESWEGIGFELAYSDPTGQRYTQRISKDIGRQFDFDPEED